MSSPSFDLSKVQFTSAVNSFKNDGAVYTGSLTLSASIPSHSFLTASTTVTVDTPPQFSLLYGYFQDLDDAIQQYIYGTGYETAHWYQAGVNNRFSVMVTSPAPNVGPLDGLLYPVINGNQVTITALVNNPYASTITYTALTIPFAFINYSLTN
jgi:hypothetical protein